MASKVKELFDGHAVRKMDFDAEWLKQKDEESDFELENEI